MQNSQISERTRKVHNQYIGFAKDDKDYDEILFSTGELVKQIGVEATTVFLNLQDVSGKTLIHHIIENPLNGHKPGIWAMIELRLKGADLNIQDNLGNTAIHTCANFYKDLISGSIPDKSTPVSFMSFITDFHGELTPLRDVENSSKGRIMVALMADIGAMLLCGADPRIKNQKGETIFGMMTSLAPRISPKSVKTNICEASCKKAFQSFFEYEKDSFAAYPWATSVVSWVEGLNLPTTVGNVSLVAKPGGSSSDDDCCIPSSPKAVKHVATVTASNGGGCTLL